MTEYSFIPEYTLRPGVHLRAVLHDLEMTPPQLAEVSGIDLGTVCGIIDGSRKIGPQLAVGLGDALGMSVTYWTTAQEIYDADLAHGARDASADYE